MPLRFLLALALLLAAQLAAPARAQVTEAQVIAVCQTERPNGAGYTVAFLGFTDVQWRVQDPFPGRGPTDIEVELWVSAAAGFECRPNNAQPAFPVLAPIRGEAYLGDTNACRDGLMTFAFIGAACPFNAASRFPQVGDNTAAGPYATVTIAEGPECTIFRPAVLGENGLRHPVVIWGNGTGATPASYQVILNHFASHGFVVAAANTANAGSGQEMLNCLAYLENEANKPASPYRGTLNLKRIAAAGHSQGAVGTIIAAQDARIAVAVPWEPGQPTVTTGPASRQSGPMLLLSGGNDLVNPPQLDQLPVFNAVNTPVFWGTVVGGAHVPTPSPFRYFTTQWLRLYLMNDQTKAAVFHGAGCTLCADPGWVVQRRGLP